MVVDSDGVCHILFVDTGQKWDLAEAFAGKLKLLSSQFEGAVFTTSSKKNEGVHRFQRFQVFSRDCQTVGRARGNARQFLDICRYISGLTPTQRANLVVVAYDPVRTGLIGLVISHVYRARLVVEINGDVTAPANYGDIKLSAIRILKRQAYVQLARLVLGRSSAVKLIYDGQVEALAPSFSHARVRVFHNYLDLENFKPRLGSRRNVFSIVGFPYHVKGIDIAIAAFKAVANDLPEWRLEIVGWYQGEQRQILEREIGEHPQITHVPPMSRTKLANYMSTISIALCSSRTEGFPRVIKEAMSAGIPCICSKLPGIEYWLKEGDGVAFFPSGDIDGLAATMRKLASEPKLREVLGDLAFQKAETLYSEGAVLDGYVELIQPRPVAS